MEAGARLGPYEILAELGRGGMGEVYRARDTKLERDVALKILPESFASDPDRLMRFEREAKTLASLNHPNIAAIYGIEEQGATRALVMELVEGEDLSALIASGALRDQGVLRVAAQLADALEAAHEAGIVHRDLKPANIKVRADGTVKVLDFGLAKTMESNVTSGAAKATPYGSFESPTMTSPAMTQMGAILGTAAYMSPEQAKGRPIDRRADVWAFGVVLYEMLTGRPAFGGATVTETIASVIKDAPDFTALPATTPAGIRRLLQRCLEKDPAKRIDSMHVVGLDLAEAGDGEVAEAAPVIRQSPWKTPALIAVVAAVVAGVTWIVKPVPATPDAVTRFEITAPAGSSTPAISPDGMTVAWVASEKNDTPARIFVRRLDELRVRVLDTGSANPRALAFSPDSRHLAFFSGGGTGYRTSPEIRRIAIAGGPSELVARSDIDSVFSLAWSGTTIYVGGFGKIQAVNDSGGALRTILAASDDTLMTRLTVINDGRDLLFSQSVGLTSWSIRAVSVSGGDSRLVMDNVFRFVVSPTGHLIYTRRDDAVLYGRSFWEDRLEATGDPVPLGDLAEINSTLAMSTNGTLVYLSQGLGLFECVWVNRTSGRIDPIPDVRSRTDGVHLSPGGRYLLYTADISGTSSGVGDAWVWDSTDGSRSRLTSDGEAYVYGWGGEGGDTAVLLTQDKTGKQTQAQARPPWSSLVPWSNRAGTLIVGVSYDGRQLLTQGFREGEGLALVNADGSGAPVPVEPRQPATFGRFSPDGRWIAYVSWETGQTELWIRPYPNVATGRVRLGPVGTEPVFWSASSQEVNFFSGDRWVSRSVRGGAPGGVPELGPVVPLDVPAGIRLRGVTPDGQRWLGVRPVDAGERKIAVILNFFEELRAKVPVK